MKTGVPVSKLRNRVTTIAAVTGSAALLVFTIMFSLNSYQSIRLTSEKTANHIIASLESTRSDATSEPICDSDNSGVDETKECSDTNCTDTSCPTHSVRPVVEISMDEITFQPDSCVYVDKQKAHLVLNEYIDKLKEYFAIYPNGKIYLVGGVAKIAGAQRTDTTLSQKRAETVRQSFVELGVDGDKLVAIGLGISDPWREDEWKDGKFDEQIAAKNRRVWVIPDNFVKQMALVDTAYALIGNR